MGLANITAKFNFEETKLLVKKNCPANIFRPVLTMIDVSVDAASKGINKIKNISKKKK